MFEGLLRQFAGITREICAAFVRGAFARLFGRIEENKGARCVVFGPIDANAFVVLVAGENDVEFSEIAAVGVVQERAIDLNGHNAFLMAWEREGRHPGGV